MLVVLDTNIVLASISMRSPKKIVIDKWEEGIYNICLTTDIVLEYEEKLGQIFDQITSNNTVAAFLRAPKTVFVDVHYRWNLIYPDLDDNKFVDCAIAARADYLVTNDRDFRPLKKLKFPKLEILDVDGFIEILEKT